MTTPQLIKAADGSHLWSQTYDKDLEVNELFAVQEDIANNVADKFELTLAAFQLLGGTQNIEAYELYLETKGKKGEDVVSGVKSALELLDEAIALDPEFALAWSFKAENHLLLNVYGSSSRAIEEADAATKAAQKALEIEPNLGDAYINLGQTNAIKSEWIKAEPNFRKALKLLDKKLSADTSFSAVFYCAVGNFRRVLELLDEMRRNDPKHPEIGAWYCMTYGLLGDRQRADKEYQRRIKSMTKRFSDWYDRAITNVRLASGDVLSSDEIVSSDPIHLTLKKYLALPEQGLVELRRIYTGDENLSSSDFYILFTWAAYFGDYELAMEVAEKSISIHAPNAMGLWFPVMREVRQLPRFKEFVREIGLVNYWKQYGWPDTNICRPVGDDDFVCD